ncbi:MAG: methyltransferase domain-containing protein [SAR324 cluster bacterium]|nr:methyltransferase domain-containing protein [SAR324 cluster bacterium]
MGIYAKYVLPRLVKLTMNTRVLNEQRGKCLAGARGRVLEVGFGNGLNLKHYPPEVEEVVGVDPSSEAEKLARQEIQRCNFPVRVHTASAEALPFDAGSFDTVAVTWTLCTIPDAARALAEIKRVLKAEGRLHFVEHGLAPQPRVARWQHRLNGIQKALAGGCHLNRDIAALIAGAGFQLETLETYYVKGPPTHTHLYRGIAAPGG